MVTNQEKSVYIDKDDEEKILKRKSKREDGMVYAHQDGVSKFMHVEEVYVKAYGKTVGEMFKSLLDTIDELKGNVKVVAKVSKDTREMAKKTKEKVEKYVV